MKPFVLQKLPNIRYLLRGRELTSGDIIEIWRKRRWVKVRVEFMCGEYYGLQEETGFGHHLYDGLAARFPEK